MWLAWIWILIAVGALYGESVSMALFLLNVAVAAVVAAMLAAFGAVLAVQIGVFVILSVLLIGLLRPRLLHALVGRSRVRTLTDQGDLFNREATVVQTVTEGSGTIRVGNAEFWSARVMPPAERIPVGSRVRIAYLSGLTAYVSPAHTLTERSQSSGPTLAAESIREEQ